VRAVAVTLRDVTECERRADELARKNERLDEFASILSHDLRNPLSAAVGYLELAAEESDSAYLDDIERAHERMETLIETLLTLAREGETVQSPEPVDLRSVSERCWQTVGTGAATVDVETDCVVYADPSRLQQLFENLYRNAIEHAGEDVTVTVGELDGGFYIEDDGPGIAESERDQVFEMGYSSVTDSTGFGLSIVRRVAEAHGWDIRVVDGETGGARFEITGIDTPAPEP
jgi:signal transduction histidine kinase